jgi:hypothetical protein
VNTLRKDKTPPPSTDLGSQQVEDGTLPEFLLSPVSPCLVQLVSDPVQQTRPSRTEAELLADGQCEV